MAKDYYKILGVAKEATDDDIKKAYRRLAHKYHPDKPEGDESKFKEISEAYQILSNKERRAQYDQFGSAFDFGAGGGFRPGANGFGMNFDFGNIDPEAFGDFGSMGDVFDAFFEGLGVRRRKAYTRGSDIEVLQAITLEEAYAGTKKEIRYRTQIACEDCRGLGHFEKDGTTTCKVCDGKGEIKESRSTFFGSFAQVKNCDQCRGLGQIPNKPCATCRGVGRQLSNKVVAIQIAPGIREDQIIKIIKAGEAGERGASAGDLYVRIKILPHKVFVRSGDDLIVRERVSIFHVALQKPISVSTLSGKKNEVEIPAGFNIREPIRIPGGGMPRFGRAGFGDLIVDLEIAMPKKLSVRAKKLLEDIHNEFD